jgi:hypothetical protein
MNHAEIFKDLLKNEGVIRNLLQGTPKEQYLWKPEPSSWSLLEVICHLYDEEREDFRARLKHTLKTPDLPLPQISPKEWVDERKYLEWNFDETLLNFQNERLQSIAWLSELVSPPWENVCLHPKIGPLSAEMFLVNWLGHDYLHIRQITRLKYAFLKTNSKINLDYAGEW